MAPLVSSVRDDGSINTANTISAYRGFLQLTLPMIAKPSAISLTYRTPSRLINLIMLQSAACVAVTSFRNRIVEVIVRNAPRRRVVRGSLNRNIVENFIIQIQFSYYYTERMVLLKYLKI